MTANEQMDLMGDFVEGAINDHINGLTDLNETVVTVTEYFAGLMFLIEKKWAQDVITIAELHHRDSLEKSRELYERAVTVLNSDPDLKGGAS